MNKKYMRQLLECIRINVKRCNWKVDWGVAYGPFTISMTKELLTKCGVKWVTDEDVIYAAHYIANKLEMIDGKKK